MPMPGPYFGDHWSSLAEIRAPHEKGPNRDGLPAGLPTILVEISLILAIPLVGAMLVGLTLRAFGAY